MRAVAEGRLSNTSDAFSTHIDRCLGCRACEQVCPAGVEYGQLLEASRQELLVAQPKQNFTHKVLRLALRQLWPSKTRLSLFFGASRLFRDLGLAGLLRKLGVAKLFSARAHFAVALLESSRAQVKKQSAQDHTRNEKYAGTTSAPNQETSLNPKTDPSRSSVMLFEGCVGEGLFARVNRATERVLGANSFAVEIPETQVCCGALHAHAGDLEGARKLAKQNITAFGSTDTPIITNAGGCGAMLVSYGHLLDNDDARMFSNRVRDIGQQLATTNIRQGSNIDQKTTTYDTSCHLLYGQKAGDASLKMLAAIPGLDFKSLEGAERCCGGAGIYNLLEPEMSARVLDEKLKHIQATGAGLLATGNPGCQMQIGAGACLNGMSLDVCHPIELLDESYRKAGFYSEE
jgi:glycolate oxidase iron-sulfur subunit